MLTTWINVKELVRLALDENKSLGIMRLDYCSSRPNESAINGFHPHK